LKLNSVHPHGAPPVSVTPSSKLTVSPDEPAEEYR
jgi:hypothetical protein